MCVANKAFKFRMYPNGEQEHYFANCFGSVRFLWNHMLGERIALYEQYKDDKDALKAHKPKTYSQWKKEYLWMYEVDNLALANAQMQLHTAYKNFFRDKSIGLPNFKSKHNSRKAYTTNNQGGNIRIENGKLKLPKIGFVRIVQHRQIPAGYKIKSVTVSQEPSGKYYASILTEYEAEIPEITLDIETALGLDYSSAHFYVDSNDAVADMPHWFREAQDRLAVEQRKLSRMVKGSANYGKQKRRVARVHERIRNQRKDWQHKKSRELVSVHDIICVENIDYKSMAQGLKFGKATNDNAFGQFRGFLSYKLAEQGKRLITIDKWYPSSKKCRHCGNVNRELTLADRRWVCPCCGVKLDRDVNAAINIRNAGLEKLSA